MSFERVKFTDEWNGLKHDHTNVMSLLYNEKD